MRFLTEHLLKQGLISEGDFNFIKIVHNVEEAVAEILLFYRNYDSSRWVGSQLVIRIRKPLTRKALADLNQRFADLLREGQIVQGGPCRKSETSRRSGASAAFDSHAAPP